MYVAFSNSWLKDSFFLIKLCVSRYPIKMFGVGKETALIVPIVVPWVYTDIAFH